MPDAAQQISFPLVNNEGQKLTVWLFTNVKNAKCASQSDSSMSKKASWILVFGLSIKPEIVCPLKECLHTGTFSNSL